MENLIECRITKEQLKILEKDEFEERESGGNKK